MNLAARIKSLWTKAEKPLHLRHGELGERAAKRQLKRQGLKFLTANFRTPRGEIDLIFRDRDCLVFVEVKTRRSHTFAYPEDSVTQRKQAHLLSAAADYLQAHPESGESWQFDVVAIERRPGGNPEIVHFENVIS